MTLQAIAIALTGLSSIAWLPVVGAVYPRFAVTLLAAAAWLVIWAEGALERLDRSRVLLSVGLSACLVSVIIATAASQFPLLTSTFGNTTGVSAPYWIALLIIIAMSSRVTLGRVTLSALAWQYVWVLPVALIGIVQSALGSGITFGFVNADFFAPMMLLFAPPALGLAAKYPSRRSFWRSAAVFLWIAAAASRTTAGIFGLGAQVLFLAIFVPDLLDLKKWMRIALIAVLLAALANFMVFGTMYATKTLPAPVEKFVSDNVFGATSATRLEMWKSGVEIWRHRLLTGVGPDEYAYEGQRYFSDRLLLLEHYPSPDTELPGDPHSLIVLLPVDFGLLGVISAVLLAVAWARGVLSQPFKSAEGHLLRWSFALGALGFGYASLFTPFPLLLGGAPMMFTGLALVRAPAARPYPRAQWRITPKRIIAAAATALALALGVIAVAGWGEFAVACLVPMDSAADELKLASQIQPQVFFYRYAQLQQRGSLLAGASDADAYLAFQQDVDASPSGVRGYGPYLVEFVRLSTVQALQSGRTDLGWELRRLREAETECPALPEIPLERAHADIAAGDFESARRELDRIARWREKLPRWDEYDSLLRQMQAAPTSPN